MECLKEMYGDVFFFFKISELFDFRRGYLGIYENSLARNYFSDLFLHFISFFRSFILLYKK